MPQNISNWKERVNELMLADGDNYWDSLVTLIPRDPHGSSAPIYTTHRIIFNNFISQTLQALATEMMEGVGEDVKEDKLPYENSPDIYGNARLKAYKKGNHEAKSEIRSAQQAVAKKWGVV